jgi:hypothetical protein
MGPALGFVSKFIGTPLLIVGPIVAECIEPSAKVNTMPGDDAWVGPGPDPGKHH